MKQHLEQLARIYNTLLTVNTKGEDTLVMADCLRALRQEVEAIQQEEAIEGAGSEETK